MLKSFSALLAGLFSRLAKAHRHPCNFYFRSGPAAGTRRGDRRDARRSAFPSATLAAALVSLALAAGMADTSAESRQARSLGVAQVTTSSDRSLPPASPREVGEVSLASASEIDPSASVQAPVPDEDAQTAPDPDTAVVDQDRPLLPSISPDSIASLEEVLAPLRAVAPAVYQSCSPDRRSTRPAPTATPIPLQRTATPTATKPTPTAVPARSVTAVSGLKTSQATTAAKSVAAATPATVAQTPTRLPSRTATPSPRPAGSVTTLGCISHSNVTFYDCKEDGFCGAMYDGTKVYEGAAACSFDLAIGTRFRISGDPTGRIYRCEDRGLLKPTWVDIFFQDPADGWVWAAQVGRFGTLAIVQ